MIVCSAQFNEWGGSWVWLYPGVYGLWIFVASCSVFHESIRPIPCTCKKKGFQLSCFPKRARLPFQYPKSQGGVVYIIVIQCGICCQTISLLSNLLLVSIRQLHSPGQLVPRFEGQTDGQKVTLLGVSVRELR